MYLTRNKQSLMPFTVKMCVFILISLFSINLTAQTNHKSVKEVKGLETGTLVKDFSLKDSKGETYRLSEELKKGPVVLIFYRGQWCPVCNKHLSQLEESLALIEERGARIFAISPEKPEYLEETRSKTNASFTLLHDENYEVSKQFDLAFKPSKATTFMYNTMLGAKLKEAHSDDSQALPVPATYIIHEDSRIIWRHFNPDYTERASVKNILNHLP